MSDAAELPPVSLAGDGFLPHTSHWGVFSARLRDGALAVRPYAGDPDPNGIIGNFPAALRHRARIARPMVRRGWLERGPGPDGRRGRDGFVAVSWDEVLDRLGAELGRIRDTHGPGAVFGGSYGWASAGRFHHAQSQVHRFLNIAMGGYVRSVNTYSSGAASVIVPHVLGSYEDLTRRNVTWEQIAEHTEAVIAFGGMALKNSMVAGGSISQHVERGAMARARARGCDFLLVGPLRSDLPPEAGAEWIANIPGSDTALMLALVHTLVAEGLHDRAFLDRHTEGWAVFERYLTGEADDQPKDADWAAPIAGIPAEEIRALARRLHGRRVLVVVAHSLQRAEHGEQPVWMGAVLAAALGQIGLPGGGYGYALGAIGYYGRRNSAVPLPTLAQGRNRVADYIPVARISDMLLNPGGTYRYNGQTRTYPDIRLVYWAGGNPFHHHQDLNRLRRAFAGVDTLVVHEMAWTATARHADIVLPCTMTLEREDIGASSNDPLMVTMHKVAEPHGEARDDYAIFAGLAERLGRGAEFTEGRDARQWLEHLYERTRRGLEEKGLPAPDFARFWEAGSLTLPQEPDDGGELRRFREDPVANPLPTPSGRIEVFSRTIDSYGEADCPGHPAWLPPEDAPRPGAPLFLVANQPATRLHSQLDFGGHSAGAKHRGREVARMHPLDAAARSIAEGDIVRLFNARGACLAAVVVTEDVRPGVVQLPTGAWYDPADPEEEAPLCVHGNPNVLTRDAGTSALAQGCTGQLTAVEVERFTGNLPPVRAFDPPGG
ncbi:Trimethylamine-N-oxide reductase [Roseomonas mucosa]|uniref:molybdopterin guanine dinucleotide-containing S/N-oxide reductase n=1 Tax=Roseomonas TaxID=125216 RepID=UPI000960BADD|nr:MULTISPECIES: molybdopterin guanine dinucleotide-containing S/N-oxide reductase [Roseomonas]ATR19758.1 Asp-tRNA(Asn)/Glu-tRNA(Gln) amidotransferase GatCAB subunit C [Roseomonas sp. FDAARGOS_362]USQ72199.1 molybdopterin guanine dinucleotide-containing S/N-oxide reductase [Roseomonas mucosa]UZO98099.1 Trimethylamine-N-oxide reductase [Roseomonas mucosa]GAV33482.1 Dimethyl sulfoxidetrimethylamine N-oxide reductase precursor [Roseomonas sp. TAS13]